MTLFRTVRRRHRHETKRMAKAGKGMRQMIQAIIAFLGAAVIVLSVVVVYLAYRCRENAIRAAEALQQAYTAETDRKTMLDGEIEAYNEIQRLQQNNELLKSVNEALLKRGAEYRAEINKLKDDKGRLADEVKALREAGAAKSQQEDDEIAANEVLQTNAKERLPECHTNVISGMPYTTITDKKSEQWALQLQAFTGKYGIRCYFDGDRIYFLAAMGSAYGRTIGDAFRVTLKCGTELYVMLGEFKDDGTDPNFFGHPTTHADGYDVTCVLEFIYDAEHINRKALQAGNFCNIECFGGLHGYGGDIAKIEYLGRKWKP